MKKKKKNKPRSKTASTKKRTTTIPVGPNFQTRRIKRNRNVVTANKSSTGKIKRNKSSYKMSAHMLALCQARNIHPITISNTKTKPKNKNVSQKGKRNSRRRPGSSMGIRRRAPLHNITSGTSSGASSGASSGVNIGASSGVSSGASSGVNSGVNSGTMPNVVPIIDATNLVAAYKLNFQKDKHTCASTVVTHTKRRPMSSPPKRSGGRRAKYVPMKRN